MKVDLYIKFLNEEVEKNLYKDGQALSYQTTGSSGFDLRANEVFDLEKNIKINLQEENFLLKSKERCLVYTGIFTQFDENFEIQVRSRSGLAFKNGIFVLNSPGTIDSDYRGEIGVILHNSSKQDFNINYSDRIAQAVLTPVVKANFIIKVELLNSSRGESGFGSTGKS